MFTNVVVGVDGRVSGRAFGSECDLLMVGSRGYGPLRRVMLGSTALNLQSRARGPLLILPRGTRYSRTDSSDRRESAAVSASTRAAGVEPPPVRSKDAGEDSRASLDSGSRARARNSSAHGRARR